MEHTRECCFITTQIEKFHDIVLYIEKVTKQSVERLECEYGKNLVEYFVSLDNGKLDKTAKLHYKFTFYFKKK